MVLDIASAKRCSRMLNVDGVCLSKAQTRDKQCQLCRKVILCEKATGYTYPLHIIEETISTMTVLTLGRHQITLCKPIFNLDEDFEYGDGRKIRYN